MDIFSNLENISQLTENPMELFGQWLSDASESEPNDPNAMALATVDADNRPSVRMVLLKAWDERGFVFFTNRESRKGVALSANPLAALCLHWKTLGRQIRIEGGVEQTNDSESDDYYNSRSFGSRIGAWASYQSQPLENRTMLVKRVTEFMNLYQGRDFIPRPPHWGGYRVRPSAIEFWHEGAARLHTRVLFTKTDGGWDRQMLYP
ncbi:MAG TPA: pyridoxamine 5'-phosphate oxidase [Micavibrio sp.]|jgi:pyridoxamine 5'-phosphate oxidase